jgi:CheY-like chemotaxis protein
MTAALACVQVLLVEDDDELREGLREYFAAEGYHVVPFRRAEAAWTAVASGCRPDVIVTDLALPGMSGVEFLQQLRAAPCSRTIPVLVLSGWERAERHAPGADAVISKSAEPISVVRAIDRLVPLGKSRQPPAAHKRRGPVSAPRPASRSAAGRKRVAGDERSLHGAPPEQSVVARAEAGRS